MKATLLTLLLAISSILYAQDTAYLKQLNSLTEPEALQFAETLGNNTYHVVTSKQSTKTNYFVVYLTQKDAVTNDDFKNCDDCLKVIYYSYGESPNKTYKFFKVSGSYDVLFPTWQKVFKPNATYQATLTEVELQRIEDRTQKINFDFKNYNDTWLLQNWN